MYLCAYLHFNFNCAFITIFPWKTVVKNKVVGFFKFILGLLVFFYILSSIYEPNTLGGNTALNGEKKNKEQALW